MATVIPSARSHASRRVYCLLTPPGSAPRRAQAKDFAYIDGLMLPASHHRCHLGPGARKGLTLVRGMGASGLAGMGDAAAVDALRTQLRASPLLDWVETIDVEQALCEYSKYDAYCQHGVSAAKRFRPAGSDA